MPKDEVDKDARKERHSGDPKSSVKGKAKKGGGGGKFTEGKPGEEVAPQKLEKGDPNYDSDDDILAEAAAQAAAEAAAAPPEEEKLAEPKAKAKPKSQPEAPKEEVPLTEEEKKAKMRADIEARVKAAKDAQSRKEQHLDMPKFDEAPTMFGRHEYQCDACKVEPIVGFRWACAKLADYDICTNCYQDFLPEETYTRRNHKGQTKKVTRGDFQRAKGQGFRVTDADGKLVEAAAAKKVKPNDPCPCGSGSKYKKCCGSAAATGAA